jgi:hypothetical protein
MRAGTIGQRHVLWRLNSGWRRMPKVLRRFKRTGRTTCRAFSDEPKRRKTDVDRLPLKFSGNGMVNRCSAASFGPRQTVVQTALPGRNGVENRCVSSRVSL